MRTQFNPETIDSRVLSEIYNGHKTASEISRQSGISYRTVCNAVDRLFLSGRVQRQILNQKYHFAPYADTPAHDPFGLCQKRGTKP